MTLLDKKTPQYSTAEEGNQSKIWIAGAKKKEKTMYKNWRMKKKYRERENSSKL